MPMKQRRRRKPWRERMVRIFKAVSSERHALLDKPVLSSWRMYSRSDKWYAILFHLFKPDWNQPSHARTCPNPLGSGKWWSLLGLYSADTCHYTRISIKVHLVDTGHPLAVDSLLNSRATGMFINVEYVRTQKLQIHPLPCAIPVYNIDGTPNEASSIREEVNLICTFESHSEYATFLITSLGNMGIILGHTWLVKHNAEIDWQTGEVKMSCCPDSCGNRPVSAQSLKEATPKPKKGPAQSPTQREWTFVLFVEDEGREHIDATHTMS